MIDILKKITLIPWRIRRLIENRNNSSRLKRIAEEAEKIHEQHPGNKVKVMFGPSFCVSHTLKIHDVVLNSLLAAKHAEIGYLAAPFGLPSCNKCGGIIQLFRDKYNLCAYCQRFARNSGNLIEYLEVFAKIFQPEELLTKPELERISELANSIDHTQLENFVYDDIPIGHYSFDLVRNQGYVANVRLIAGYEEIARQKILNNLIFYEYFKKALNLFRPDLVITCDASYAPWNLLFDLAKKMHIPFYNYYPGLRSNTFFYVKDKIAFDIDISGLYDKWKNRHINETELDRVNVFFKERKKWIIYDKNMKTIKDKAEHDHFQKIVQSKKPLAVLYTNVLWDLASLNKDVVFSSVQEAHNETVRFFIEHPEYNLIVKPHPADLLQGHESKEQVDRQIRQKFPILPKNILILRPTSPISAYDLIDKSNVSIVHTTTVGIESAILGTPTVTVGRAHYRNKGFTFDPSSREEYFQLLNELLLSNPDKAKMEKQKELAKKYYYLYNFVYFYDFKIMKHDFADHGKATVVPRSLPPLLRNFELNRVAEAMMAKQEIPFSDSYLEKQ